MLYSVGNVHDVHNIPGKSAPRPARRDEERIASWLPSWAIFVCNL